MQCRSEYMSIDSAHHKAPLGSKGGQLASFSSCGPSFDGLIKPDVVAPGTYIMSTQNSFFDYETYDPGFPNQIVYKTEANGREYAISPVSGTSISSPIAAGVIALWLQADPNLTPQDIMGVLERTSHQPEPEITGAGKNNYYGYGEIDAYAGLLDILGLTTSVPGLSMHQPQGVTFRLEGSTLYVDGMDDDVSITVYNVNGKTEFSGRVENGAVKLPALDAGVYAVQVGTVGSTLIRIEN
jgi:subtilisin family serine protease